MISTSIDNFKPFLRWAGSKKKLLPILKQFWSEDFERYVEPFMGSACLFFALQPRTALLADINLYLVSTFNAVRDHPKSVSNRLAKMTASKDEYYAVRERGFKGMRVVDLAANFIFLNRYCFNGLYRTNTSGKFNVPFASSGTGALPSPDALNLVSKALQRSSIVNLDFEETLAQTKKGDFVYLDPPYAVGNRRVFRQYGPSSFGLDDLSRLANALRSMESRGVKFVLSYAWCAEASKYFGEWPRKKIMIQRNIAGFATDRRRAAEVLISNCFPPQLIPAKK